MEHELRKRALGAMTRTLIVGPAWVGDMVMTESLVSALKRQAPDDTIDLLAPPWTAPLGERMEGVAATKQIASIHGRFDLLKRVSLGAALKGENYDLAIVLPGSIKSAIAPFVARIPKRRGYVGEMRYGLLNDARRLDKEKLPRTIDRFVALAGNDTGLAPTVTPPVLRHDPEAARAIAAKLRLDAESRPVVALCPGAEYGPAKQWPATHFAALAAHLCDQGYATWIFGSKNDKPIAEEIVGLATAHQRSAEPKNLCGTTNLLEALDLMSLSAGVVTNDSGLMHIAAAIGRPVVALYGSTTPAMTPPLAEAVRIVEHTLPCRPCFKRACPLGHLDCLNLIGAEEVSGALNKIVGPRPAPIAV
jgi:heptosyltransferase-2